MMSPLAPRMAPRGAVVMLDKLSTRNVLFDQLEHGVDWAPLTSALHRAVASANPRLLPGETEWEPPPLPGEPVRHVHEPRTSWALRLAYFGPAFRGFAWQQDRPLETVAGRLDHALTPLLGRRPTLACAGRTDAGVSALNQLVSFYAWPELTVDDIREAIDGATPDGSMRLLTAQRVPRSFHATFSTRWRRYVYLLPANGLGVTADDIDRQLAPLVGSPRDYAALGRGLPRGKETTCTLMRASARAVAVSSESSTEDEAVRVELVADRFLRRQVRTLVASAVMAAQEEASGEATGSEATLSSAPTSLLLRIATSGEQERTAHPAPARGLVFAGSGGEDDAF